MLVRHTRKQQADDKFDMIPVQMDCSVQQTERFFLPRKRTSNCYPWYFGAWPARSTACTFQKWNHPRIWNVRTSFGRSRRNRCWRNRKANYTGFSGLVRNPTELCSFLNVDSNWCSNLGWMSTQGIQRVWHLLRTNAVTLAQGATAICESVTMQWSTVFRRWQTSSPRSLTDTESLAGCRVPFQGGSLPSGAQ